MIGSGGRIVPEALCRSSFAYQLLPVRRFAGWHDYGVGSFPFHDQ